MKKLFLLAATLFGLSTASFAQEQGDDNGFGLKLHAGFCGEKYGAAKAEVSLGFASVDGDWVIDENRTNTPLFGLSMDNRWYVGNPGNFGIAIDARWLDLGIGKSTWSEKGIDYSKSTNVQLGLLMPGVVGTYYFGNEMAVDAFYNVGATFAVNGYKNLTNNEYDDAQWGFGISHFMGAAFRYKVFQVGFEYNIAPLKSIDWFEDTEEGDELENAINSVAEVKTRFNNMRVFLGFKF